MKTGSISLCLLVAAASLGGCRQAEPQESMIATTPTAAATTTISTTPVLPETMTLSAEQLAALDWSGRSPSGPKVIRKQAVDTSGTVFDILFPTNKPWQNAVNYVSSGQGGQMALVGLDVSAFRTFALKFTLVAIDGAVGPTLSQELIVGAVAGPTEFGRLSRFEPLTLGFARQQAGVARTPIRVPQLREVGIHIEMANPQAWNPEGSVVTLLVEPVVGAVIPSMPVVGEEAEAAQGAEMGVNDRESSRDRRPTEIPDFGPGRTGAW